MKKNELVHVATFGQPQGLKGEIKLNILTSSFESFKKLNQYFIEYEKTSFDFNSLRQVGKKYVASLINCNDRDAALKFKGKNVFSLRENFPKITSDQYYIIDLIDSKVLNIKNSFLGNVCDIKNFGAEDLMEIITKNKKKYFIPMNKDNLINVDIDKKIIIVNPILGLID